MKRYGKAHWTWLLEPALSTACVSVSKSKLVEWTEYLIDNAYINVGNNVYHPQKLASKNWHTYGNRLCTLAGKIVLISLRVFIHEELDA